MKLILVSALLIKISSLLLVHDFENTSIGRYLQNQDFSLKMKRNCLIVINVNPHQAQDIFQKFYEGNIPLHIFNRKDHTTSFNPAKYEHAIVFLERLSLLNQISQVILDSPIFWSSRPKFHFLIVESGVALSRKEMMAFLENFWTRHFILNYVIVYEDASGKYRMISYDPFRKLLTNLSEPDRLSFQTWSNLYGYKLRIMLGYGAKFAKHDNKTCLAGYDCKMMNNFMKFLNASADVEFLNLDNTSLEYFLRSHADIWFNSVWLVPKYLHHNAYSLIQSEIEVLVLKASLLSFSDAFCQIFEGVVWILMLCLIIAFRVLNVIFEKIGVQGHGTRCLELLTYFFLMIFENCIQGVLIFRLLYPPHKANIETTDDLVRSGMDILAENFWQDKFEHASVKLHFITYNEMTKSIFNFTAGKAYLFSSNWAQRILTNKTESGHFYSEYYHVPKENFGVGFLTYYIQRNSPFKSVLRNYLLVMNDHGLTLEFGKRDFAIVDEVQYKDLTIEELEYIFIMLGYGLAFTVMEFIVELLWHNILIRQ